MADPTAQETRSYWQTLDAPFVAQAAEWKESCDVCVIGAGIAGLSAAYLLSQAGRDVCVLDMRNVGEGQSFRSTAHMDVAMDEGLDHLIHLHGQETAKRVVQSHAAAIDFVESVVTAEEIACDFARVDGFLLPGPEQTEVDLERERDAALSLGLSSVQFAANSAEIEGPWVGVPCVKFPRQAQMNPYRYVLGLAAAVEAHGGRLFPNVHVCKVREVRHGQPVLVCLSDGRELRAQSAVVASNSPFNDRVALHTKQAAYRTYAIALDIPKRSFPMSLCWDMEKPYHYVRLSVRRDSDTVDTLIVGGEDHKTGQDSNPAPRFDKLEEWTRKKFPTAGEVTSRWSGQVLEPHDGLGLIGRNPGEQNVYVATGDSGQGITHGSIAGLLLSDLIQGKENPWEKIYNPSRWMFRSASTYVKENLNTAWQYRDYLKGGRQRPLRCSVCPHLGGVVRWNPVENSWDCPAHGSRFDTAGKILSGPATNELNVARCSSD